ncbi:MAG: site-specific DNA-methyltransferase [Anaerolineales bacterium]|nr:site-specific DNA-methyltransferase [Anaerolineales bacterium]
MSIDFSSEQTSHRLIQGDARKLGFIPDESIHLVVTSPPYWILKRYNDNQDQLGHVEDYEQFLNELSKVWKQVYRVLVPGGRLVCVVGDVCLSRRKYGRHVVVTLHADICVSCRKIGFDNLNPIIWHKISNANYEISNGSKFLGKPYEPNAIIKNDIEFILMQSQGAIESQLQNRENFPESTKITFNDGSNNSGTYRAYQLANTRLHFLSN